MKKPVNGETLASAVHAALRNEILTGKLRPETRLRIGDLSGRYDVGLAPVREALNRLAQEGLVTLADHKGFSVTGISKEDLLELNKANCSLSELALRESILHGESAWEEGIVLAFHRMNKVERFKDNLPNPDWYPGHQAFHASLLSACPSKRILGFTEHLFTQTDRYRRLATLANYSFSEATEESHRILMNIVLSRDADQACEVLTKHYTDTCMELYNKWDAAMHLIE